MCGIVGYVGKQQAQAILLNGLSALEYRGYDSAGVAMLDRNEIQITKHTGRVATLAKTLQATPYAQTCGISHTRWATHGQVTNANSHPHTDEHNTIAIVHNGVIENYQSLRDHLIQQGIHFTTDTDTEVIAQLLGPTLREITNVHQAAEAIQKGLARLQGTYGLLIISKHIPNTIFAARLGSPLVVAKTSHGNLVASDGLALSPHAKEATYLNDHDIAIITQDSFEVISPTNKAQPLPEKIHANDAAVELGSFTSFMEKEIFEQPQTVANALRGHIDSKTKSVRLSGLNMSDQDAAKVERIIFTACGTSYHAALIGEYWLEEFACLPVEVEYASELRYRHAPIPANTLLIALSQSGETADTLAAIRQFKKIGHEVRGIVNVVGSTIARETGGGLYLHAGPEIGVASTKAFIAQLSVLMLLTLYFAKIRGVNGQKIASMLENLQAMPTIIEQVLYQRETSMQIAKKFMQAHTMLYLGRGYNYPIALEGALKLKEVSYIHAEGYPAAEMKHGPIALVDNQTPSLVINPQGPLHAKVASNMEEIKARGGPIIAIATDGDKEVNSIADDVLYIPEVPAYLQPFATIIPLQLLAYHMATIKSCDVDKPRNLAKSVTVE